jgi:hypothetical protein
MTVEPRILPTVVEVVDGDEPVSTANPRKSIRHFIWDDHPEPSLEVPPAIKHRLRNGDPFPIVIAIVPAYNEQDSILAAIASLRSQTRPPDEIIVVANNCTDDTEYIAFAARTGQPEVVARRLVDFTVEKINDLA